VGDQNAVGRNFIATTEGRQWRDQQGRVWDRFDV